MNNMKKPIRLICVLVILAALAACLISCTPDEEGGDPQTYLSLSVQGEITGGGNPVLQLKLNDSISFKGTITAEDVTLGGALASMSVDKVEQEGNTIKITLGGEATLSGDTGEGTVTIGYTAMSDGNNAQCKVKVNRYYPRYEMSDFARLRREGKILSLTGSYLEVGGVVTCVDGTSRFYIQNGKSAVCVGTTSYAGELPAVGDKLIVRGKVSEFIGMDDIDILPTSITSAEGENYAAEIVNIEGESDFSLYFASTVSMQDLQVEEVIVPEGNPMHYRLLVNAGSFKFLIMFNADGSSPDNFAPGDIISFEGVCIAQKSNYSAGGEENLYVLHVRDLMTVIKQ